MTRTKKKKMMSEAQRIAMEYNHYIFRIRGAAALFIRLNYILGYNSPCPDAGCRQLIKAVECHRDDLIDAIKKEND